VGDVVKNFNGQPVKSNEDVQRFVQQLGQTDQARLFVMRGGTAIKLQYQIQP
jgi:general secretion pathway protein C